MGGRRENTYGRIPGLDVPMSEKPDTIDSLRQKLRIAERVKQAAIDCTKSLDTVLDELVWERQDLDAHEIPAEHLQTMIARYPHYADDLRDFTNRWNADKPLTDEELEDMEVDEEEVKRSTASCMRMIKWSMMISNSQRVCEEAVKALENCRMYAASHRSEEWATNILRFCAEGGVTGSPLREES